MKVAIQHYATLDRLAQQDTHKVKHNLVIQMSQWQYPLAGLVKFINDRYGPTGKRPSSRIEKPLTYGHAYNIINKNEKTKGLPTN